MAQELALIESALKHLEPKFAQVLGPTGVPAQRIIRTVMVSIERQPALLQCGQQSIVNGAMSAACLGLEVDGVTGQAFLIPFAGKAQLVIGYKGMNTLGARSGFAINASVIREGDKFDYKLGSGAYIDHRPIFGNKGKVVGAWAIAQSKTLPDLVTPPMSIDDLMAVMAKSPAVMRGKDTPWKDPAVGFPAMCEKTVKRRLARQMPLNTMVLAAALDEAYEERGRSAFIHPDRGLVIDGEAETMGGVDRSTAQLETARYAIALEDGGERTYPTGEQWLAAIKLALSKMAPDKLDAYEARNRENIAAVHRHNPSLAMDFAAALAERRRQSSNKKEGDLL